MEVGISIPGWYWWQLRAIDSASVEMVDVSLLPSWPLKVAFSGTNNWTRLPLEVFFSFMKLSVLNIRLILFAYMLMKKINERLNKCMSTDSRCPGCASDADENPTVQRRLVFSDKAKARNSDPRWQWKSPKCRRERTRSKSAHIRIWFLFCFIIFVLLVWFGLVFWQFP